MKMKKINSLNHRSAPMTSFILMSGRVCLAHCLLMMVCSTHSTVFAAPAEIIPYEGPPGKAEQADKILVPYARYVELWNRVHPDDTIDLPQGDGQISFADVQYKVTIGEERLNLSLSARIETYGKDWVVLGLPFSALAVTEATLNGEAAQLQTQGTPDDGMVLMIPGKTSGRLGLQAVMKPESLGRRGSARFSLPPLPGAVMTVVLPEKDLELEVDQIEAAPAKRIVDETVEYTFGLGMMRSLALRWSPSVGSGAMDRTLSADSQHDVYVFHWAIVGVSKITYSFSGGEYDRFALLIPKESMLTEINGANIRDFRQIGEKTVEGKTFKLIEICLQRAAQKQHELTARWITPHPDGGQKTKETEDKGQTFELSLSRAGGVSRESGTVTLHSVGGMSVKVVRVTGGRRADVEVNQGQDALATVVARYYWPYRPFSLFVQLSRSAVIPQIHLNQLVRINTDRVELLVQANLKAQEGQLFSAPSGPLWRISMNVQMKITNFFTSSSTAANRKRKSPSCSCEGT
jgi:hypothetical protein